MVRISGDKYNIWCNAPKLKNAELVSGFVLLPMEIISAMKKNYNFMCGV